jgi:hypothetical protein
MPYLQARIIAENMQKRRSASHEFGGEKELPRIPDAID